MIGEKLWPNRWNPRQGGSFDEGGEQRVWKTAGKGRVNGTGGKDAGKLGLKILM